MIFVVFLIKQQQIHCSLKFGKSSFKVWQKYCFKVKKFGKSSFKFGKSSFLKSESLAMRGLEGGLKAFKSFLKE